MEPRRFIITFRSAWLQRMSDRTLFLRRGVVSTSPYPQARGPPLVGSPRLLIRYIRSCPPYWGPSLHPQPEDAPYRGDRDPLITAWSFADYIIQGGSNMTGTDLCVNKCKQSRSYLNNLVYNGDSVRLEIYIHFDKY